MTTEDHRAEAETLLVIGANLASLRRIKEAKSFYDEIVRRFRCSRNIELRGLAATAHFRMAGLFREHLHLEQTESGRRRAARRDAQRALACFDAMLGWLGAPSDQTLRNWVVRALLLKGDELVRLHRYAEAVRAFGKASRFIAAEDRVNAVRAARMQGRTFMTMRQPAKALANFDRVLDLLGTDPAPKTRGEVGDMLFERGRALAQLGRYGEAVDAYNGAIAIKRAQRKPLLGNLPLALIAKAEALVCEKRHREAIAVCNAALVTLRRQDIPYSRARACRTKAAAFKELGNQPAARRAKAAARLAEAAARREQAATRRRVEVSVHRVLRGESLRPWDLVP